MATKTVVLAELKACVTCTLIIANGEDTSQADSGEAHGRKMMEHYGAGCLALVVTCHGEQELCDSFSTVSCDVCGDPLAGERHAVVELGKTVVRKGDV